MGGVPDPADQGSELAGYRAFGELPQVTNNYYGPSKPNGHTNGGLALLQKIILGIATFSLIALLAVNGFMWKEMWSFGQRLSRIEGAMGIEQ